jgi:hypothetical protein
MKLLNCSPILTGEAHLTTIEAEYRLNLGEVSTPVRRHGVKLVVQCSLPLFPYHDYAKRRPAEVLVFTFPFLVRH